MKKIVPFTKEIAFKSQLSEVTSISLEHTLQIVDHNATGEFVISGDYRLTETSMNTEPFSFKVPLDIEISEDYKTEKATIDIDDFYYEIMNNNALVIHIDVKIDRLEELPLYVVEEPLEEREDKMEETVTEIVEEKKLEKEDREELSRDILDTTKEVKSLFANLEEDSEAFVTYKICIVRENDTIESIQEKYGVLRDELEKYNNLSELKIGDKLIIPALFHAKG